MRNAQSSAVRTLARRLIVLATLGLVSLAPTLFDLQSALAANPSGDLRIVPLSAYNFVVDSNVTTPATYAPEAGTVAAQFCNDGGNDLTDVSVYVGDFKGSVAASTPGVYPVSDSDVADADSYPYDTQFNTATHLQNSGEYSLTHEGGSAGTGDATRYIGTIPAGECVTQYWIVSYPRLKNGDSTVSVTGNVKPDDDLWLNYDFWASAKDGASALLADTTRKVTMRNEISASANKIWPNTTSKVPQQYLDAIGNTLGWDTFTPTGGSTAFPGQTISTQGFWYDFGNVGAGFDNNGDFIPDRNAWAQPVGDPGLYDPGCFRLVRTYGLVIVKLAGGGELLIPFEDQLYFENLPDGNTGAVGLVFYEYVALDGACTATLTPYQEVASGFDNEKFSGDYGTGIPPLQSVEPEMTLDKSGPTSSGVNANLNYSITFENNTCDESADPDLAVSIGNPDVNVPLVIEDAIPSGTTYVAASAALTPPTGVTNYDITFYNATTGLWYTNEADAGTVARIRWILLDEVPGDCSGASNSGVATFSVNVPSNYLTSNPPVVYNTGEAKFDSGPAFLEDTATTLITGIYSLSGTVYRDDGAGGGVLGNAIKDNASETGINTVKVSLYYDANGDGDYTDATDFLVTTTNTNASGAYSFGSLPAGSYITVVDTADTDIPAGYGITTPSQHSATLSAGTPSVSGLDYGFAPALSIVKRLDTTSPVSEGAAIQYTLLVSNNLPGSGSAGATCSYNIWSSVAYPTTGSTPPGGTATNAQWYNVGGANGTGNSIIGRPDSSFAYTNMANNTDIVGLSGFNMGNQGGTITSVKIVIYAHELVELKASDAFIVHVYYNDVENTTTPPPYSYTGAAYFTSSAGTDYLISQDISALRAWTWADFAGNLTELQLEGNKGSGAGTTGEISVDAVGFIVTTNQSCGDPSTILNPVPLTDTFNAAQLQFQSASVAPSSVSGGTITWNNVGPIYPGQTKEITLTFIGLNSTTADIIATNTATSTGAKFADGTAANTPVSDNATVTIQPLGAGSISGFVWSQAGSVAGWNSTTGYDGTDDFIPFVGLTLFGCYTDNPASGGTLVTSPNTTNTCDGQSGPGNWFAVPGQTDTTDANGAYSFDNLSPGYYYVQITSGAPSTQTGEPIQNSANNGATCAGAACDLIWQPSTGTIATVNLNTTNFNSVTAGEAITNVSFGFNNPAMIFGNVFQDYDGDGSKDATDTGLGNGTTYVRVYLQDCGTDGVCGNGDDGATQSVFTDANGNYQFTGLTAGGTRDYRLTVDTTTLPGGASAWTQTAESDGTTNNSIIILNLANGATHGSNDFGYQQTGAYSIGDTLFYDWDGDATQDGIDEGIASVTVYLYVDLDNDGVIDATDPLRGTTSTDISGQYLFSNLPNGNYIVQVDTADPQFPATILSETKDPSETGVCAVCDSLSKVAISGASNLTQDFGYWPSGGGSIGDTVWKDIDGNGSQSGVLETGIANITVNLQVDWNGDGTYVTLATTTTDSSGKYLFDSLPAGSYRVVVDQADADLPEDTLGTTYALSTTSPVSVTLAANQTYLTADFGFQPLGAIGDTIFWDANANGQQDWSEAGVAGVTVYLCASLPCSSANDIASDTTDSQGRYLFSGLDSDPVNGTLYYVGVETATGPLAGSALTADPDADGVACPGAGGGVLCDSANDATLYAGTIYMGADFGYQPSNVVGDRVWFDQDRDGVQDASELGIGGVTVYLCATSPCASGNAIQTTTTDIDGNYLFSNVTNGSYYVGVNTGSSALAGLTQSGDPDQPGVTCTTCDSTGAVTVLNNAVLIQDFGYALTGAYSISGTVCHDGTNEDGACAGGSGETALSGRIVNLYWNNGSSWVLIGQTTTNGSGDYTFSNLPNGTYTVSTDTALLFDQPSLTTGAPAVAVNDANGDLIGAYRPITINNANVVDQDFAFVSDAVLDFGDLPTSYNTLISDDPIGPRHIVPATPNLYLGSVAPDSESDGNAGATATGDDTTGTGGVSEENGVSLVKNGAGQWIITCDVNGCVAQITVVAVGAGWLTGYMDFDVDGNVTDGGEMIVNQAITTGTYTINVSVPTSFANSSVTSLFARFRIMPSEPLFPTLSFVGLATNGEVEDYNFGPISTTPVSLAYFRAVKHSGGVDFEWSTSTEAGNVGFNLYVQDGETLKRVNAQLIPSQAVDSVSPLNYQYSAKDLKGNIFYIEDVSLTHQTKMHGPYSIGKAFGERPAGSLIPWASIRAENDKQEAKRQADDAASAAQRSAKAQAVLSAIVAKNRGQNAQPHGNGNQGLAIPAQGVSVGLLNPASAPDAETLQTPLLQPLLDSIDAAWANGDICNQGVYNSLRTKVEQAQADLDAGDTAGAVSKLTAFINEAVAQAGKCVTQLVADDLAKQAQDLIDAILNAHPATPTPTPTPMPTSTSTPTPTATNTPETPTETATPTATDAPPTPSNTPTETNTPTATLTPSSTATAANTATATATNTATTTATPSPTATSTDLPEEDLIAQLSEAINGLDFPVVDLRVKKTGLYRVTYEQLVAAGLDLNNVPVDYLAVMNKGAGIPIYVSSGPLFGPGLYIEFYGQALDTLYTDTNVYWLVVSQTYARRVTMDATTVSSGAAFATHYMETATLNRQRGYAFHSPLADPWYDTSMLTYTTPKSWSYTIQTDNLVAGAAPSSLEVTAYGSTDWPDANPDHHLMASFNGQQVMDDQFNGLDARALSATLPAGSLVNGANTLTLTMPGDAGVDYDLITFDNAKVTYPRAFVARAGSLSFTATGSAFRVTGLPTANVAVYRVDSAGGVTRLNGVSVAAQGATYDASFAGLSQSATYIVASTSAILTPTLLAQPRMADIKSGSADFVIVSHPNFISGLAPLVQARQSQGYSVKVVSTAEIYRQFNYGIFDPQAIQRYIRYAANHMGARYVLLVGGDMYDYRNYVYTTAISFVPSLYAQTDVIVRYAPVDPLYADITGDRVPDLALGRFPVRTTTELNALVTKTLAYGSKTYGGTAVFAADASEPGAPFAADSDMFISQLGSDWNVTRAYLDNSSVTDAQTALINAMNQGVALTNYIGHSSYSIWTFNGLFNATQASQLTNAGRPTVVNQFGCWNTYYVSPTYNTMAHKLLLSGDRGAAAVMGATTLTQSDSESLLGGLLMPELVMPGETIGDAMLRAKTELAGIYPDKADVLLGWTLLGDPTMIIVPGSGN